MKFYRDRSSLFLPFLRGSVLTYVGVDNIITGPFRQLMIKYFRLGDFGSNAREEYLYYLLLFFGLLQLLITIQSAFQPVVEIIDTKVILRTKERTLSVIKSTFEITNLEFIEHYRKRNRKIEKKIEQKIPKGRKINRDFCFLQKFLINI